MLVDKRSLLDKWREISFKKNIPLQASLELTFACNQRCLACYIEKNGDVPQMPLAKNDWLRILKELRDAGTLYLVFMGGEAMLNPNFWEISKKAHSLGFHLSLVTNGLLISSMDVANQLKDAGYSNVSLSIYSLNAIVHDKLTNTIGSHKMAMNALKFCQKAGLIVGVNCLLTSINIEDYFGLANWCIEKNIEIKDDAIMTCNFSGDLKNTNLRPSYKQLETFFKEKAKLWPNSIMGPATLLPEDHICNVARGKCAVDPHGNLLGCIEVREPLGNLLKQSFEEIWTGPVASKWRNLKIKDLKKKKNWELMNFCDFCPGMSFNELGDPLKIIEYVEKIAEIKYKIYKTYNK